MTEIKTPTVEISASMMCINWLNAKEDLLALKDGGINYLHWDILDGEFVPDFTMGSSIIAPFRDFMKIQSDFHLMVEEPNRLFNSFPVEKGDVFTIHQECSRNLHRDLVAIRRLGRRAGVAISPGTPLETLEYVIEDADVVLLLMVDPGYKGQKLVPQTLRKIEKLKQTISDLKLDVKIEVDGNVNSEFIPEMVAAGADILVGGSSGLFRKDIGIVDSIKKLRESIEIGLERRGK